MGLNGAGPIYSVRSLTTYQLLVLLHCSSKNNSNSLLIIADHLGICKAKNCHKGPGPCGCPDCSKPHKKHHFQGYCDAYDSAYEANSSSSGGDGDGSDRSSSFYDDGSTTDTGPTASRSSYMWWIVGGVGAAAAAAGSAFALKKRVR